MRLTAANNQRKVTMLLWNQTQFDVQCSGLDCQATLAPSVKIGYYQYIWRQKLGLQEVWKIKNNHSQT